MNEFIDPIKELRRRAEEFRAFFGLSEAITSFVFTPEYLSKYAFYHGPNHLFAMKEIVEKKIVPVRPLDEKELKILGYAILFHDFYPYQTRRGLAEKISAEKESAEVAQRILTASPECGLDEFEIYHVVHCIWATEESLPERTFDINYLNGIINIADCGFFFFNPNPFLAEDVNDALIEEAVFYGVKRETVIYNRRVWCFNFLNPTTLYSAAPKFKQFEKTVGVDAQTNFFNNMLQLYADASRRWFKLEKEKAADAQV